MNWKATAKREGTMNSIPFVNDFEKEGRKTVWLFLDAREWMRTGSTVENAFEYAIQATLGVSSYLSRNCGVGVSFYNCRDEILPGLRPAAVLPHRTAAHHRGDRRRPLRDRPGSVAG